VCYSRPTVYAYVPNFVSIALLCRPLAAKNPNFCQFLRFFGLQHLVLSPIGKSLTKLKTGTQRQTFPYPTASKSFLYSNAFMAILGAQTLTFKSVTDKQTNRQKNSTFLAAPANHLQERKIIRAIRQMIRTIVQIVFARIIWNSSALGRGQFGTCGKTVRHLGPNCL